MPVIYAFAQVAGGKALVPAARRPRRRPARRRAPDRPRAAGASPTSPDRSTSRRCASAATGFAQALERGGTARPARPCPGRRVERGLRPRGGGRLMATAIRGRCDLLRQRPDRARRHRLRCANSACACPTTSPWSASTTGRSSPRRRGPPLTTIDMNLHELGRQAGLRLLDMIDGPRPSRRRAPAVQPGGPPARAAPTPASMNRAMAARPCEPVRKTTAIFAVAFTAVELHGPAVGAAPARGARAHRAVPLRAVREDRHHRGARRHQPPGPLRLPLPQEQHLDLGDVLGFRHRQVDRDGELYAGHASRSRARRADRRRGRAHREGAAAGRLFQQLLPAPRAGEELDQPARLARALLRRPHDRGRGRARPGDRQDEPARRRAPLRRLHGDAVRAERGPEARLLRPRGDRAGAGQALPAAPASAAISTSRSYFIDERGRAAALLRQRGAGARRRSGATTGTAPTNTTRSHVPVREQDRVVGHAVRAMYLYCAMADLAAENRTTTALLEPPAGRSVARPHGKRLYVTGGLGPSERQRGLHHRLRPAERDRLRRDLRRGRAGLLGAPHAAARARRALRAT